MDDGGVADDGGVVLWFSGGEPMDDWKWLDKYGGGVKKGFLEIDKSKPFITDGIMDTDGGGMPAMM